MKLPPQFGTWLTVISFALASSSRLAQAEPEPAQAADSRQVEPTITLPVPLSTPVETIAGSWEPTQVILDLTLNAQGQVEEAAVIQGDEPFASAALRASSSFRFAPALRNGEPVPARIHFAVEFFQAPAPLAAEHSSGDAPSPATEPPSSQDPDTTAAPPVDTQALQTQATGRTLDEVVVLADVTDPGATTLTRGEVQNLAGSFGDPLRAIENMPGVTPIVSGLPLFFVRGAPPGNVGYFVDGIRLPLLYHAFLGPSVIHPAFIRAVHLSAGPLPAQYGRYAGAALEVELEPPEAVRRAEASVRLFDAGAYAQSPFHKDKGYVQLAGRYSYTALLFSLFSPGQRVDYWDYQGLVGYHVTKRDEISVFGLGSYDYIGQDGETVGGTEFHRADVRWAHRFSDRTKFRWAATYGYDRTRTEVGFVSDQLMGTRVNLEHDARNALIRSGADFWVDNYKLDVDATIAEPEVFLGLFPTRTDLSGGAWVDVVLFRDAAVQLIPGVRADVFSSLGATAFSVDPRLTAEVQLSRRLRAIHSLGVAHQSPNFVPNVPAAQAGGMEGGLQRSLQAATKYELELPDNMQGSLGAFINGTDQLTDPVGLGQSFSIDENSSRERALGRAFGVELFLKRPLTRRLGGLLSYTFSHSLRSFDRITTKPGYDRRHVVNGAISYLIGAGFRASVKFALASGIPGRRTTLDGYIFDHSRSRPLIRLDAKVEKRFTVSPNFNWGIHLEVLNSTNTGNVTTRTCNSSGCKDSGTAPITFPSLGVDFVWE